MDILLVDDHSLILSGVGKIVEGIPGIGRIFTATSLTEADELIGPRMQSPFGQGRGREP